LPRRLRSENVADHNIASRKTATQRAFLLLIRQSPRQRHICGKVANDAHGGRAVGPSRKQSHFDDVTDVQAAGHFRLDISASLQGGGVFPCRRVGQEHVARKRTTIPSADIIYVVDDGGSQPEPRAECDD
jgi:hypothetical protein